MQLTQRLDLFAPHVQIAHQYDSVTTTLAHDIPHLLGAHSLVAFMREQMRRNEHHFHALQDATRSHCGHIAFHIHRLHLQMFPAVQLCETSCRMRLHRSNKLHPFWHRIARSITRTLLQSQDVGPQPFDLPPHRTQLVRQAPQPRDCIGHINTSNIPSQQPEQLRIASALRHRGGTLARLRLALVITFVTYNTLTCAEQAQELLALLLRGQILLNSTIASGVSCSTQERKAVREHIAPLLQVRRRARIQSRNPSSSGNPRPN